MTGLTLGQLGEHTPGQLELLAEEHGRAAALAQLRRLEAAFLGAAGAGSQAGFEQMEGERRRLRESIETEPTP